MEARLPMGAEGVTERQREVARLIAEGKTNPQIAEALGISLDGAKYHVSELLGRLGLSRREEVAEWYREHFGWRTRLRARIALPLLPLLVGGGGVAATVAVVVVAVAWGNLKASSRGPEEFPLPVPAGGLVYSTAIPLDDGRVFLALGMLEQSEGDPGAWIIETRTGRVLPVDVPSGLRRGAALLDNGRVALSTPFGSGGGRDQLRYVDPATGEVSLDPFHLAGQPRAFAWSGDRLIYAVTATEAGATGHRFHAYRPGSSHNEPLGAVPGAADEWVSAHDLGDGRAAFVTATQVVLVGSSGIEAAIETNFTAMPTVAVLPGGRLLIAGGLAQAEWESFQADIREYSERLDSAREQGETPPPPSYRASASDRVQLVDPASGTVEALPSMSTGRVLGIALPLADGRVLLAGGLADFRGGTGTTALPAAMIYDPASGTSDAVSLPLDMVQAAAQLDDGRYALFGSVEGSTESRIAIWQP